MNATNMDLPETLRELDHLLDEEFLAAEELRWRWAVRRQLVVVRDTVLPRPGGDTDGWLAARGGAALRQRHLLLARLSRLGAEVLEHDDLPAVRDRLRRLVVDVSHHVQRLNDLAYDAVELELGGSE